MPDPYSLLPFPLRGRLVGASEAPVGAVNFEAPPMPSGELNHTKRFRGSFMSKRVQNKHERHVEGVECLFLDMSVRTPTCRKL